MVIYYTDSTKTKTQQPVDTILSKINHTFTDSAQDAKAIFFVRAFTTVRIFTAISPKNLSLKEANQLSERHKIPIITIAMRLGYGNETSDVSRFNHKEFPWYRAAKTLRFAFVNTKTDGSDTEDSSLLENDMTSGSIAKLREFLNKK